jgi:hypothetical protein
MYAFVAWLEIYEEERNDNNLVCWPIHFLLMAIRHIFPGIATTIRMPSKQEIKGCETTTPT